MFFPHAGLPTPEWHIFKKLYYSSNSYYIFAETEMEAIMSLSTLRLLTKGHCTLKMNSIQRFHIMTLIPYDLFALPIIISNSWDTQGPKKKVHSTGDEAHYKYIFEMGRWGQT